MNHHAPTGQPGRRWDGSRYGQPSQRLLRLAPDTRSRALRAPQAKPCTACGNLVEWYPRHGTVPVPLHPHELPVHHVPEALRWHVDQGVAHPYGDGTPWCRVPHPPLCPAPTATDPTGTSPVAPAAGRHGRLEPLRRRLALHTRRLIDTGRLAPPPASATAKAPALPRDVVHLLRLLYLAPSALDEIRCVAQTRNRARCAVPLADRQAPWGVVPVPPAPGRDHLTGDLTGRPILVRDLTGIPYSDQLRWRHQHCPAHATTRAADLALPEWEPFDAFAHHQHIRPAPDAAAPGEPHSG